MTSIDRNSLSARHELSGTSNRPAFASSTNVVAIDFAKVKGRAESVAGRETAQPQFKIAPATGAAKPAARVLLLGAIFLSAALHAGLIYSTLMRDSGEQFGALAEKSETFSLAMEQSLVLESITTETTKAAAAAAASSQAGSVQSVESQPQELAEVENDPVSDEPPPKPIKVADVTPATTIPADEPLPVIRGGGEADAPSEIKADQLAEIPVEEMPEAIETKEDAPAKAERKKETEKEKKSPQKESHQQVAGSTSSRSNASQPSVNGQVSASSGNALSYGAMVRAQLSRNKPAGNGLRGTVRVSFGIGTDGNLSYLRLSESSGSSALDGVALAVVKNSAPFVEPPAGLTATQLSYVIPFYFR